MLATEYVVARPSHRTKDVAYVPATAPDFDKERHILDVYSPKKAAAERGRLPGGAVHPRRQLDQRQQEHLHLHRPAAGQAGRGGRGH